MLIAAVVAWFIGVDAERVSLESVATPLSVSPQERSAIG
jgi:hypothetical protein